MKFDWGSRCAECGKPMEPGMVRVCEKGGPCSWYIPAAAREVMEEMYEALKDWTDTLRDSYSDMTHGERTLFDACVAALAKAEGRQS